MRIANIDADILAYTAASVAESEIDWGDGVWTTYAEEGTARRKFTDMLEAIKEAVAADEVLLVYSDSKNWRKDILPTYKANRTAKKPMLLKYVKEWSATLWDTMSKPGLEGDDVLGILATKGKKTASAPEVITCSLDKDFKTIPGLHYNFGKGLIFTVTTAEADRYHLYQALIGDATDGYGGCPGVGPETATEFLNDPYVWVPKEHVMKSGPNKGKTVKRWAKEPLNGRSVWDGIVSLYDKAGLSEEAALVQARVARICRASDYDFNTQQVKLWTPIKTPQ